MAYVCLISAKNRNKKISCKCTFKYRRIFSIFDGIQTLFCGCPIGTYLVIGFRRRASVRISSAGHLDADPDPGVTGHFLVDSVIFFLAAEPDATLNFGYVFNKYKFSYVHPKILFHQYVYEVHKKFLNTVHCTVWQITVQVIVTGRWCHRYL